MCFLQGEDESIHYVLTTTAWGSNPLNVVVTAFDITDDGRVDVTVAIIVGAPVIVGDDITLPAVENVQDSHVYRIEVQFDAGGNTWEAWFLVYGEY